MKLLFIRHGEPDYSRDCLTENGLVQAALLAKRLENVDITAAFHSPMGRAAETAQICMDGRNIPLTMCEWLHEFDVKVHDKDLPEDVPVWDILPANWTADPLLFDRNRYIESDVSLGTEIAGRAAAAAKGLDEVLACYGLVREGEFYRKLKECDETLVFFCHFGITCVMIAHLLGVSPVITLQGMSCEPTAIATLCTDDSFGKEVNFRLHGFGDIHHLPTQGIGKVNYQ